MDKQKLHQELEKLHAELQEVASADPNDRELFQSLAADIRKLLEQTESETHHYRSLRERLRETIAEVEASHPRTTLRMRQLIDQIAFMGI